MIKLTGIGHVNLRVADQETSKRFYRDVLGFQIAEEDPAWRRLYDPGRELPHTRYRPASLSRRRAAPAARTNRARAHRLSGSAATPHCARLTVISSKMASP